MLLILMFCCVGLFFMGIFKFYGVCDMFFVNELLFFFEFGDMICCIIFIFFINMLMFLFISEICFFLVLSSVEMNVFSEICCDCNCCMFLVSVYCFNVC